MHWNPGALASYRCPGPPPLKTLIPKCVLEFGSVPSELCNHARLGHPVLVEITLVWGQDLQVSPSAPAEECGVQAQKVTLSLMGIKSLPFSKGLHEGKIIHCSCSGSQSCLTLCDPMDYSMPGFSVHHYLPEFIQTHVHWVSDTIQLSHPLSPPSPPALNPSQHQGLFQWVGSLHQMAKVLELQLQHQSFQWIFRVEILKVKKKELGSQFFFYFFLCSCLLCVCMCVYDKKKYIMWDLSS